MNYIEKNTDTYLAHYRLYYEKNGTNKISNLEANVYIEIPNDFQSYEDISDCFKKIIKEVKTKKFTKKLFKEEVDKNENYEIKRVLILSMTKIREGKKEEKEEKPKKNFHFYEILTFGIINILFLLLAKYFLKL